MLVVVAGKTTFFRHYLLPILRLPVYVKVRDKQDFAGCSSIHFLDSEFELEPNQLKEIPPHSIIFYGA